jgi:hypothetical protein
MGPDLDTEINDYLTLHPGERKTIVECSLAESLWRIVRRILRTQSKRTHLEVRVLREARSLADRNCSESTRDLLAKLVVDELLRDYQPDSPDATRQRAVSSQPGLQAFPRASTFAF